MTRRTLILAGLCAAGGAGPLHAQDARYAQVDRIVAVVGTKPILLSQIDEQLNELRWTGVQIPTDSAGLADARRQITGNLVDEELLVQTAQRDTMVKVTEQQVQAAVEQKLKDLRQNFASEMDYQRQLRTTGFGSAEEYRRFLADEVRRQLTVQALMQRLREKGDLRPITPTDSELHALYEAARGSQKPRPALVTIRQIVVRAEPDSVALAASRQLADSVLGLLRRGGDFATLARRFSDDPSRDQGGELGWFRRGQMVREFEQVAFSLRPGQISDVVRSPFGYHIIEVEHVEPGEVQARHILFAPTVDDSAVARARKLADSLAVALRHGAPADSLSRLYHDPVQEPLAEDVPRQNLPQSYQDALANANVGDIVGPLEVNNGALGSEFAIVILEGKRAAGEYTFDELKDQLKSRAAENKGVQHYLDSLRQKIYVSVRF